MPPRRPLRSSTFLLTVGYLALFCVSTLPVLIVVYLTSAEFIEQQTWDEIDTDLGLLISQYQFGGLPGLLLPLWAVLAAVGLAMPNTPALALTRHGEAAGTAAALLGATQFGVAALTAPFVGVLGNDGRAMALVVTAGMAGALAVLLLVVRPRSLVSEDDVLRSDDVLQG